MTAVEHLGQALRLLEAEASEIEHRMSFVRAAIEAFGLDADQLLMDQIADEEPFPWEIPEHLSRPEVNNDVIAKQVAAERNKMPEAVVAPTNWVLVGPSKRSPEELNGHFAVVDLAPEVPDWEAVPGADVSVEAVRFLNGVKNPVERAGHAAELLGKDWQSMVRPVGDEDAPEVRYGRTSAGRWDWDVIAHEIGAADAIGERRALRLLRVFGVSVTTAQWMVKRCREQGLIDIDRPTFTERNARERAAAAL